MIEYCYSLSTTLFSLVIQKETIVIPHTQKKPNFKPHYDNFIGGEFVPPVKGGYFDNISPIDGKVFTKAARSTIEDVELAIDAAHNAFPG